MRPSSLAKPAISKLRERGVEVRSVDVSTDGVPQLEAALEGVDTLISILVYSEIGSQIKLADAAKLAGVKRFITNDWGTACVRGVRRLFDEVRQNFALCPVRIVYVNVGMQKAKIQDYVKSIDLGYTFIDVGYW